MLTAQQGWSAIWWTGYTTLTASASLDTLHLSISVVGECRHLSLCPVRLGVVCVVCKSRAMNDARHEIIIRRLFLQLLAVATHHTTTTTTTPLQ